MKLISRIKDIILASFDFRKNEVKKHFRLNKNERDADHLLLFETSDDPPVKITPANLLCIKSKGNQAIVFYSAKSGIQKKSEKNSLKNFTKLVESRSAKVIRCHKSYIVNLNKLDKISGTSKGYKIHIKDLDFPIPVSRRLGIDDLNQLDMFSES